MKLKTTLLNLLLLAACYQSFAHALWIETSPTGKQGQQQEVKIFFGEYAGNERDSTANWFSNLRDVKLSLTLPSGEKKWLECKPATDHFTAQFTPDKAGVYTLSISHEVGDVYGTSKLQYYCGASVQVGNSLEGISSIVSGTNLAIQTKPGINIGTKTAENVAVYLKKAPLAKAKVIIASPDGWTKNEVTDSNGNINFKPYGKGRYMIEATYTDATAGTQNGKAYKAVWHCITYCVEVK